MFEHLITWLLLPLGIALGWYLRRNVTLSQRSGPEPAAVQEAWGSSPPPIDEVLGLLLEHNEGGARSGEMQLQLGTLFRKRGEVDRALTVHGALVERPDIDTELRTRARVELAADYESAGLFDHAESLYRELADSGVAAPEALAAMRRLYEQGHDWQQAWDLNQRLQAAAGRDERGAGAHYACELAEAAEASGDRAGALRWARTATHTDPAAPRPWLLTSSLKAADGDLDEAIEAGWRAVDADPRFLPEVLDALWRYHESAGRLDAFAAELHERMQERPSSAGLLKQAELVEASGLDPMPTLIAAFTRVPSWALLEQISRRIELAPDAPLAPALTTLRGALEGAAAQRPRYLCGQCGMRPGRVFWQCPSCRSWGSIAPMDDRIAS